MSTGIVDGFELIEVDEDHGDHRLRLARGMDRLVETGAEQGAVREVRQRVVLGQLT